VRVGMEATGYSRWFEGLLAELGFEVWIGECRAGGSCDPLRPRNLLHHPARSGGRSGTSLSRRDSAWVEGSLKWETDVPNNAKPSIRHSNSDEQRSIE
jgi:hypothetical protein